MSTNHKIEVSAGVRGIALSSRLVIHEGDQVVVSDPTYVSLAALIAKGDLLDNGTTTDPVTSGPDDGGSGDQPVEGAVLSGHGGPGTKATVEPLDGVNDPWQWSDLWGGWVRAWHVTWDAGAAVDITLLPDDPRLRYGSGTPFGEEVPFYMLLAHADVDPLTDQIAYVSTAPGWRYDSNGDVITNNSSSAPLTDAGAGVLVWMMNEPGWAHTTVPVADFDPLPVLASGFTVGEPYVWDAGSAPAVGSDGQWYIDLDTSDLYGPRTNGTWIKFATLPPPA